MLRQCSSSLGYPSGASFSNFFHVFLDACDFFLGEYSREFENGASPRRSFNDICEAFSGLLQSLEHLIGLIRYGYVLSAHEASVCGCVDTAIYEFLEHAFRFGP